MAKKKATAKKADGAKPKKAFGGYTINFFGQAATLESVFGSEPVNPAEMNKKLWAFVKGNNLANKK